MIGEGNLLCLPPPPGTSTLSLKILVIGFLCCCFEKPRIVHFLVLLIPTLCVPLFVTQAGEKGVLQVGRLQPAEGWVDLWGRKRHVSSHHASLLAPAGTEAFHVTAVHMCTHSCLLSVKQTLSFGLKTLKASFDCKGID